MSKVMKDGWNVIHEKFDVYVENGYFIEARIETYNGIEARYPYVYSKTYNCLTNVSGTRRAYKEKIWNYEWK